MGLIWTGEGGCATLTLVFLSIAITNTITFIENSTSSNPPTQINITAPQFCRVYLVLLYVRQTKILMSACTRGNKTWIGFRIWLETRKWIGNLLVTVKTATERNAFWVILHARRARTKCKSKMTMDVPFIRLKNIQASLLPGRNKTLLTQSEK